MPDRPAEHVLLSRFDTALGGMSLASSVHGLLVCTLPGERRDTLGRWLTRFAPRAEIDEGRGRNAAVIDAVCAYLAGELPKGLPRFELDLRGTDFQRRVWGGLQEIPYGETRTYAELAESIDAPRATRAVGTANGSNPVSLVVPCHRVVAAGGRLGGYGGGLDLKRRLLALEQRVAGRVLI